MKRHSTMLRDLRAEARAAFYALLLLLLVPVLHPVAEARAMETGNAFAICSTFGAVNGDKLALADDMSDCLLACSLAASALAPSVAQSAHAGFWLPEPFDAPAFLPPFAAGLKTLPFATGPPLLG
jgi:hypothetical protein